MRHLLFVRALTATLFLATIAIAGETGDDGDSVDYARLQRLRKSGEQNFSDGKYQQAIKDFNEFIAGLPDNQLFQRPRAYAYYYVACGHSLLKNVKEAVASLEKAMANGFREFSVIDRDKDLDHIRSSPEFTKLIAKYRKLEQDKLQKFDFDLTALDGKKISKKGFLGKVLVVDIWGTWCPPCRMEIPHFIELQKKYGKAGLQIVGIAEERVPPQQAAPRVEQFIKRSGINYPCALATRETLATIPNLRGFPTTIFIGRDGRVRTMVVGYHDLEDLELIVKPLLAQKAPEKGASEGEKKADAKKGETKTGKTAPATPGKARS